MLEHLEAAVCTCVSIITETFDIAKRYKSLVSLILSMKAVVIYDTKHGNTEKVAKGIAKIIGADTLKVGDADPEKLKKYDIFVFGSPTHAWNMTAGMKQLFKRLSGEDFGGKKAAAFDTKFKGRFAGGAAKKIEKKLRKLGFTIGMGYVSFYVTGMEGPLAKGEMDKAKGFVAIK
jgi:flavodoxin